MFNLKELVPDLQSDNTPRGSGKYSYNLTLVKVSFRVSRNSVFNVKELVPELQNDKTPRAERNTHIT